MTMENRNKYSIGIDTGGTHTDIVLLDETTGIIKSAAVPTTPDNLIDGIMNAIAKILSLENIDKQKINKFVYGTTVVTNMIVQGESVSTAFITTKGFIDVLEIGRAVRRGNIYDFYMDQQKPLIPRYHRFGIKERINARGEIVEELDLEELEKIIEIIKSKSIHSVSVCLLNSYVNNCHEEKIYEILRKKISGVFVSLSSRVLPEFREYERMSTTVIDAYAAPTLISHLRSLKNDLIKNHGALDCYIMQSVGGLASFERAEEHPVKIIHSGPTAGVIGGVFSASLSGFNKVITLDMGGTSCDISLVDGQPRLTSSSTVNGYPVKIRAIDIATIGAGGGSIAWIDPGGMLKVGPKSAGARPGPACYGYGGDDPTITDANLALGRINDKRFLGGDKELLPALAAQSIQNKIGAILGLSQEKAAEGIIEIAIINMVRALKVVTVSKGFDPRDFTLIAFGGAGPMHAARIAEEIGIKKVVIPFDPGTLSALGLLVAPIQEDYVTTKIVKSSELSIDELAFYFDMMEQQAVRVFERHNIAIDEIIYKRSLDMRYLGQGYEVNIPVNLEHFGLAREKMIKAFNEIHMMNYGYTVNSEIEIVNIRLSGIVRPTIPKIPKLKPHGSSCSQRPNPYGRRKVFFKGEFFETPIYNRDELFPEILIEGPAIIEEANSTTVVYPQQSLSVDDSGNLIITL